MIAQAAYQLLTTSAPIAAKLGGRIHYDQRPEGGQLPAVVIQSWTTQQDRHLKGIGYGSAYGILRLTVFADTYLGADDIAGLIFMRLEGYRGAVEIQDAEGNPASITIERLHFDDSTELPSDHRDGQGQVLTHGRQLDYRFAITTPEPTHA